MLEKNSQLIVKEIKEQEIECESKKIKWKKQRIVKARDLSAFRSRGIKICHLKVIDKQDTKICHLKIIDKQDIVICEIQLLAEDYGDLYVLFLDKFSNNMCPRRQLLLRY